MFLVANAVCAEISLPEGCPTGSDRFIHNPGCFITKPIYNRVIPLIFPDVP